jgi:hypothetical protein
MSSISFNAFPISTKFDRNLSNGFEKKKKKKKEKKKKNEEEVYQ